MNNITLVGRLTRDPEIKFLEGGKAVAKSAIAVDRLFKENGEKVSDFFDIEVWGKTAETLNEYAAKGNQIAVSGRIESRKYNDKIYWTVKVENLRLLERKKEADGVGF